MDTPNLQSGITFFYYSELSKARIFYEDTLGFEVVDDQGWAVIYNVNGSCFFGIVDEDKGFCRTQKSNAVLFTLVVDDAGEWYEYLNDKEVKIATELDNKQNIGVKCFFLRDPGGYALEIQEFTEPEKASEFEFLEL